MAYDPARAGASGSAPMVGKGVGGMKKRVWLLVAGLVLLLNGAVVAAIAMTSDGDAKESAILAAAEGEGEEEEEGLGPAEPDDYFLFQRASDGELPQTSDFTRAVRQAQEVRADSAPAAAAAARNRRDDWELEGPTNIGGRLADLAIDPQRPDTVYVAAATGGVWKTTDGGATLEKAWDDDNAQSMGAIAIGRDGTIWAGTGELNPGGGSITFGGTGIFRSDDDGRRWRYAGLRNSGTIGRIVVHPNDPRTVYVGAGGSLFNTGGERGVYKTTDGGRTWRRVLANPTPFSGVADLAMDPRDPNRIYAAMWDHRREPDVRTYGGVGSGLWRTDDGGATWKRLDNVVTKTPGDPTGLAVDQSLGRIGVALAPSNPDRVYVITSHTNGDNKGFYVSNDRGETFNTAAYPGSQGGFGWWFGRIWVDPANQDHLFVAGVNLRESFDAGLNWGTSQGVHADQHGMEWDSKVPNRVYLGNDGGLYRSDTNGATRTWTKATYEPYTQHYSIEVAETDPSRLTAGTQDNSCIRTWPAAPDGAWNTYCDGDGEYVPIDWSDPRIFYGCFQYGACTRYDERSGTLVSDSIRNTGPGTPPNETPPASVRWNWHAPLVIDPNNPEVLYFAGNQLNRSTDRGETWTALSPPHPNDLTGTFEPGRVDPKYPNWGTITAVSVSKTEPETIYVGTDTGRLWKTENLGQTWTEFVGKGLPDRWVTRVAIDPDDEDTVYATFSGFRNGEDAAHVYRTEDGGRRWRNISGNLPNAPVNDVVLDSDRRRDIYVGTDVGVFALREGKRNWKAVGRGLPLAPVLDLRLHEPTDTLYAGTFGRSAWKVGV
jgi:photosystem II stability/assembly factor-like uncharacterized protein